MPSKYIARASIPDPDRFAAHLRSVFLRAASEGIHIQTGKGGASALLRLSVEWGAKWAEGGTVKATIALPERAASAEGARLESARKAANLSHRDLAAALGYASHASIVRMEQGKQAVCGAAKTWLNGQSGGVE